MNQFIEGDDFRNIVKGGVDLVPVDSVRKVGVTFDESLNFAKHQLTSQQL